MFVHSKHWLETRSLDQVDFFMQRTGNAEGTGSNPFEALIFFRLLLSNCLNWKIYYDDHSSLHLQPQFKNELFHIYFTSTHITRITSARDEFL